MKMGSGAFELAALDHVALRVRDLEASAEWYAKVLGLQKVVKKEWGPFPVFMVKGDFGLALFPIKMDEKGKPVKGEKVDHFAFRVDADNFKKAQQYFTAQGLKYDFKDHHFFHSIYIKDPDGHVVELTMPVEGAEF